MFVYSTLAYHCIIIIIIATGVSTQKFVCNKILLRFLSHARDANGVTMEQSRLSSDFQDFRYILM